jgi:hypothetical protein
MNPQAQVQARLPSEDVIISAPMSYAGSAQRIMRVRRRARTDSELAALTAVGVVLVVIAWVLITVWYLMWGLWLIPYRLHRRGARKRRAEALRHRELLAAIQGGSPSSALTPPATPPPAPPAQERIGDAERENLIEELRAHLLAGRLTPDEFEQRLGAAHAARTWGDLTAIRGDLPAHLPSHSAAS